MLMIVWGLSVRIWSRMLASLTMLVQILPLNGLRKNLPRIANRNYPYPLDKLITVRRSWANENKIRIRQPLSSLLRAFLLSNLFRLPGIYCFGFNRSIVFFFSLFHLLFALRFRNSSRNETSNQSHDTDATGFRTARTELVRIFSQK